MSESESTPLLPHPHAKRLLRQFFVSSREHAEATGQRLVDDPEIAFLGFCLTLLGNSHAQLLQDLYVLFKLGLKREGYFVEFGATDGLLRSNTLLMERELGWSGILAEPFPRWHEALRANRSAIIDTRCVWRTSGEIVEFFGSDSQELATIAEFARSDGHAAERTRAGELLKLPTVSLTDLLSEHGAPNDIDYISIDTEGSEPAILSAFDFDRYRVKVFTVEHNYVRENRDAVHGILSSAGYVREFEVLSAFDDWYYLADAFQ